jgi:hypothetical protein
VPCRTREEDYQRVVGSSDLMCDGDARDLVRHGEPAWTSVFAWKFPEKEIIVLMKEFVNERII